MAWPHGSSHDVPAKYQFTGASLSACRTARDSYFTTNPAEKIASAQILLLPTDASVVMEKWDGSAWTLTTSVIQGPAGPEGPTGPSAYLGEFVTKTALVSAHPSPSSRSHAITYDANGDGVVSWQTYDPADAVPTWTSIKLNQSIPVGTSGDNIGFTGTTAARLALRDNTDWNGKQMLYFDTDVRCLMSWYPHVQQWLQYNGQIVGTTPPSFTPTTEQLWYGTERIYTWNAASEFWKIRLNSYISQFNIPTPGGNTDSLIYAKDSSSTSLRIKNTDGVVSVWFRQDSGGDKYQATIYRGGVLTQYSSTVTAGSEQLMADNVVAGEVLQLGITLKFYGVMVSYDLVMYGDKMFMTAYSSNTVPTAAYITASTTERAALRASGNTSTKFVYDVTLNKLLQWKPASSAFIRHANQEEPSSGFPTSPTDGQKYTSSTSNIEYTYSLTNDLWDCEVNGAGTNMAYYSRYYTPNVNTTCPSAGTAFTFANVGTTAGSGITYNNGFFGITNSSSLTQYYEVALESLSIKFSGEGYGMYSIYSGSSSSVLGTAIQESTVMLNSSYRTGSIYEDKNGPAKAVVPVAAGATVYIAAAFQSIISGQYIWGGRFYIKQLPLKTITQFIPATATSVTEWTSYTPTITGSTSNPTLATSNTLIARYKVVGKSLHLAFTYHAQSATGSAGGNGTYKISLPNGFTINTAVAPVTPSYNQTRGSYVGATASTLGNGWVGNGAGATHASVVGNPDNTVSLYLSTSTAGTLLAVCWGSGTFPLTDGGTTVKFTAEIPIL